MPKKTLKEKIKAESRIHTSGGFSYSYSAKAHTPQHTQHVSDHVSVHDIRKTLILGTLFIAIEFALFFLTKGN